MKEIYSFTDKNGKRGVIGSYVYPATLDLDPRMINEVRRAAARKVDRIYREKQTYLKFNDSPGMSSYAKNHIIIKMEG
jgi:hypothetical protein